MPKVGKIAPIRKSYNGAVKTIDQQLASNGYERFPGTSETIFPYKELSGKYRTGLDETAPYLSRLSPEDRVAEVERIKKDRDRLEDALGIPGILAPTSIFYNFSSTKEQLVKKLGAELKINPVKVGTKEEFFDCSDIMKEITWNWIKVHPRIAPSLEAYQKGNVPADIKYYVVDDEAEAKDTYNRKKEINKAIVEFEGMIPSKKKQVARLMGLPVTESTPEEIVYNLMDSQLKETEFAEGQNKGKNPVRLFTELATLTNERLKVKDLIEQAIQHSIYRVGPGGKLLEGSITVGTSTEDLVTFLLDEKNQLDLIALEKKLTNKKIEKS